MLQLDIHYSRNDFVLEAKLNMQSQVLGVLGASGAGKSTLLSLINGLLMPDSGFIRLHDTTLFDSSQSIRLAVHQRQIATVFQDIRLFPHLNVLQNLCYGLVLRPAQQRQFNLQDMIALLQLEHLCEQYPSQLSGGEAQRVALGRGLLMSPKLLLLDEPLSSLDKSLKQQILPYLKQVQQETQVPMLYVSHDQDEIAYLCSRVITLQHGRLLDA